MNEISTQYDKLVSGTSQILWDWDLQTGEIVWSDNYTQLFGWQLPADKKSTDKEFFSRIHSEDHPGVINQLQRAMQNPDQLQWQLKYRFQRADGSFAYLKNLWCIIWDENGIPCRMLGAIQDDTESWYHEELLSLEKNIFESFSNLNSSFVDLLQEFLAGVEKLIPQAYTSVLFIKEDEMLECLSGTRWPAAFENAINGIKANPIDGCWGTAIYKKEITVVSDIKSDHLFHEYRQLFKNSGIVSCWSFPLINKSGTVMGCLIILYRGSGVSVRYDLGLAERVRNTLQSLMQNNQLLQEIKRTNERFNVIMKATNDLIWDWDLVNGTVYRDVEGVQKVYGINDESIINHFDEWIKRIHPNDRMKMQKTIRRILSSRNEFTFELEYRFMRENGTYAYVNDRGILLLNSEGKPYRMIGAAHDITERKQLEKELIDKELEKQRAINQATIDTQEQERTEIGKELHDNVNQVLTTTKLYLELAAGNPEMKDQLIEKSTKNIL